MKRRLFLPTFAALILALAAGACGDDDNNNTPTAPTPPTTVTETYADTIGRNGARTHNFSSGASGTVTATLTTLAPDSTLTVGFSLGTWNGVNCQLVITNDAATQGTVITGGVSSLGSLCVRIYDVGNITNPISYEITVVHP
jgi:hypothetical protein